MKLKVISEFSLSMGLRPDKLDLLFLISHFLDLGAGGRLLFITSLFNLISDFLWTCPESIQKIDVDLVAVVQEHVPRMLPGLQREAGQTTLKTSFLQEFQ